MKMVSKTWHETVILKLIRKIIIGVDSGHKRHDFVGT